MTVQVPVSALRLPGIYPGSPGEESKDVTPEQGDPVSFSVEGVVSSVSGAMATVEVRLINGERPEASEGSAKHEAGESKEMEADEEANLAKMASEADEEEYA